MPRWQMGRRVRSAPLHYRVHHGARQPAAPPLLLVHGAGGNLMHWPAALRRLPGHTIYALDLPGHGRSAGESRRDIGAYADAIRGFADALALPPFVLAGHSMGGAVALEFALRYGHAGGRLAGLILIATGAKLPVAPQIMSALLQGAPGLPELLASWAHGASVDANLSRLYVRRLREVKPDVMRADYSACSAFDRSADVACITAPALIICGDADRMTPLEYSRTLADRLPHAQLVVAPGAGHMVMLEQPDFVAQHVATFLDGLAGSWQAQPRRTIG